MDCTSCPSCRLGVSSATGRLRWCVPEKGSSRRFRFVVTAVVLLLVLAAIGTVIVVRLTGLNSPSNSTSTALDSSELSKVNEKVEGNNVTPIRFHATGLRHDAESGELEKRGLPYLTTQFVHSIQPSPLTTPPPVDPPRRRKRRRRRRRKRDTSSKEEPDIIPWDVILNQRTQEVIWLSSRPNEDTQRLEPTLFQLPVPLKFSDILSDPAEFPSIPGEVLEELDWNPVPSRSDRSRSSLSSSETPAPSIDTSDGNANSYVQVVLDARVNDEIDTPDKEVGVPIEQEEARFEPTDDYDNLLLEDGTIADVGGSATVVPATTMSPEANPTIETSTIPSSNNQSSPPTTPSSITINTSTAQNLMSTITEAESVTMTSTPSAAMQNNVVNIDPNQAADMNLWGTRWNATAVRNARARTMLSYMDHTADPCGDFYQYACGNWAKRHTIPADKAAFDTFEMLRESLDAALRRELEIPIKTPLPTSASNLHSPSSEPPYVDAQTKARYLYRSCMDHGELARRGSEPLLNLLKDLGGWPVLEPNWNESNFNWLKVMAQLRLYNNDILVSEWVGPDIKNSHQYVIQLDQASLGLPSRDYFLAKGNSAFVSAYKEFIVSVATILGAPPVRAEQHAEEIVNFEKDVATIMSGPEDRRNVSELYTRLTVAELSSTISGVDWTGYLSMVLNRSVSHTEPVVVFAIPFLHQLVGLLGRTPNRTIADYMLWRFVRHRTNQLDDRFASAKQRLYRSLFGREAEPPRWKTCVANVNSHMGMALGSIFVQRYFDQTSKEDTVQMTKAITTAFREMLSDAVWMDNETRRLAARKLDAMQLRIGYPDFIVDPAKLDERFKGVEIRPDRFFENTLNILQHVVLQEQSRLGTPVNKSLWNTPPAVVNAYYSRNKNQIMFPAGILQPPFYHRHLPRSLNFGGIGVVIGHEMTHGFDDKGRLFDEHGNLRKWWDELAVDGFRNRAQCLVEQYGNYKLNDIQLMIDGESTQGENIADNSGVKQAFTVYNKWLKDHGPENETLPGVPATPLQLFFLNFAQVWCGTVRPQAMRSKMKTAVHAPGPFRVVGTLSNSREFSEVFNCPVGSPMNPSKKCSVW